MNFGNVGTVALGVIGTLLAMSILSIAIIVDRTWIYRRAARHSRLYARDASRLLRLGQLREAQELARRPGVRESHLARIVAAGLEEWEQEVPGEDAESHLEVVRTAVRHAASDSLGELRRGLVTLGTIASTAPFVGLFGTTSGIINAFRAIGVTGSTNMGAISSGISEALITTAFGLFVAIPAVWAYNALGGRVERFATELDRTSDQLMLLLARRAH